MMRANVFGPLLATLLAAAPLAAQQPGHGHHAAAASQAPGEQAALQAELDAVRAATARYRDHAQAVRDGYRLFAQESPLMGEHWYRRDLVRGELDLAHPSTLQYANLGGRRVLVGVAYSVYRRPGDPLPSGFSGASDAWHTHDVTRLARAATADRPLLHWLVERRIRNGKLGPGGRTLLTMLHAWVWSDNPDGVFALQQRALPYLRAGLPAEWAREGDEDAAQGIQLLAPGACDAEVRRLDRLARLERRQASALTRSCQAEQQRLRAEITPASPPLAANAAATAAWRRYLAARGRILDAEQIARVERVMESAMEHDMAM
jgi:hypothetical protein